MPGFTLNPSEMWRRNHPWATLYSFTLGRPPLAIAGARLMMNTDMRLLYRAIEEIGQVPAGSAILDVPCGGGVALRGLHPRQKVRYVAADIAPAMLDRTAREASKRGLKQVELCEADIAELPFEDATFDLTVTFTGLHCFPDPHAAVGELARVTKHGGRISGSLVLADARLIYKPIIMSGRAAGLMGPSATLEEVQKWLGEAGFMDLALERSGPMGYFTATRALSTSSSTSKYSISGGAP